MKEYAVELITENALGTILFGASKVPTRKMQDAMNRRAKDGWRMVFQFTESRRLLLLWSRESVVLTFERDRAE